jgi:hypothetical protein
LEYRFDLPDDGSSSDRLGLFASDLVNCISVAEMI